MSPHPSKRSICGMRFTSAIRRGEAKFPGTSAAMARAALPRPLIGADLSLMLKTPADPGGTPTEAFNAILILAGVDRADADSACG
jgi:hypothetical protein